MSKIAGFWKSLEIQIAGFWKSFQISNECNSKNIILKIQFFCKQSAQEILQDACNFVFLNKFKNNKIN